MGVFHAGTGKDGKGKTLAIVKTYISPWEKAMKGDERLLATLKAEMPGPIERKDLPKYKSFNRYFPQYLFRFFFFMPSPLCGAL